jgi:tRNA threonylcarbamoyl adenosine modification protein YeaZ
MSADPGSWLLAIDSATTSIVVAVGSADGTLIDAEAFEGRYRHSQELLPALVRVVDRAGVQLGDLAGIIVGTGPGAFTGLRVGIATAKTLAHELSRPIVGIPTSDALLAGHDGSALLWLPSGPRDRVAVITGGEPLVVAGADPGPIAAEGMVEIAVDLDGRAPEAALALGRAVVAALPASLLRLGAARLTTGDADDPERLVPRYASPPRGAPSSDSEGGVAWSHDPR